MEDHPVCQVESTIQKIKARDKQALIQVSFVKWQILQMSDKLLKMMVRKPKIMPHSNCVQQDSNYRTDARNRTFIVHMSGWWQGLQSEEGDDGSEDTGEAEKGHHLHTDPGMQNGRKCRGEKTPK